MVVLALLNTTTLSRGAVPLKVEAALPRDLLFKVE
jgi:hypothetical protein